MLQKEKFAEIVRLYQDWNEKINVISRKDIDNIFEHHIVHSLAIGEYRPFEPGETVLDVGTGGGFPGIPLAVAFPQTHFTLCDSIGKKIKVAREIAKSVGLDNVECVNARAETLSGPYDWIVSRAVTSLENFYPFVKGHYKKGILYLKGGDVESEIVAMCSKYKLNRDKVSIWPVNGVIDDEYFAEKFVIDIRK